MSLADALGAHNTFEVPPDTTNGGGDDAEMEDLFGDDEDGVAEPPTQASASPAEREDSVERQRRHLEYGEDEGEPDETMEPKIEADVQIPDIPYPRPSDGKHWIMRLPNYLKLDPRPFEKDVYTGPENDDDVRANPELLRERSASIKLEVENTMRWRWIRDANGNQVRQSNARVVKWSDGSLSLQLGKELYDISPNVNLDPSVAPTTPQAGNGLNYLVAQHKRSMVLQAEAPIAGTLGIRPVGMDTDAHRKLVRAVSQKNTRLARIKIDDRAPALDQLQGNAGKKKSGGGPRRPRDPDAPRRHRKPRMSTAWSDDEEEDLIARGDSDDEPSPAKRRAAGAAKKKKRAAEDGEEGAGGYKTGGFVVSDSESDEDGSPKKKKRKADRDASPDELEQMERQIERREAERKKAAGGKATTAKPAPKAAPAPQPTPQRAPPDVSSGGEEEMDIESEEDDDMPQVSRKTGRRKVAFEDDDE